MSRPTFLGKTKNCNFCFLSRHISQLVQCKSNAVQNCLVKSRYLKVFFSGCEPLIQLYEILIRTPGVYGARFSGAGFRGCCVAFVKAEYAEEASLFVKKEYLKVQPHLASYLNQETSVVICDAGDCARII